MSPSATLEYSSHAPENIQESLQYPRLAKHHLLDGQTPDYLRLILTSKVYEILKETPLVFAPNLSAKLGNQIWLKREDLQEVFSFKIRGAYNFMANLSEEERWKGVITCSAGNHAQGVALSGSHLGIPCTIVMPSGTPSIKVRNVARMGAKTILHGADFDEAKAECARLAALHGLAFVPPYDDPFVIAGQGTVGMEILKQFHDAENLDGIFASVGGGGLVSGISEYVKRIGSPRTKIIGVETVDGDAMKRSLAKGERVTLSEVGPFADGTAVKIVGNECFRICKELLDGITLTDNDEICAAIKDIFEETRSITEPSGALALAGLKHYIFENNLVGAQKRFVAVVSGANMNFDRLRFVAERAELGEGREALISVDIPETPGSFVALHSLIHPRPVTEFLYRFNNYSSPDRAHLLFSFKLESTNRKAEISALLKSLEENDMKGHDISDNELAKSHARYMIGGTQFVQNERVFRFEFPERPNALRNFLLGIQKQKHWNISMFHYRNHGADLGKVLAGIQVPPEDHGIFDEFLKELNYTYIEETANPPRSSNLKYTVPLKATMPSSLSSSKVDALIFDLRDVLFSWPSETTTSILPEKLRSILSSHTWFIYECGQLAEAECYTQLGNQFSLHPDEIQQALHDTRASLTANSELIALIQTLKSQSNGHLKVFAMSNISQPDYAFLHTRHVDWSLFDHVFTSGSVGERKPNLGFYRHVLQTTGVDPARAIFVDEKLENVLSARSLGFMGVVFRGVQDLRRVLLNLVGDPVKRGKQFLESNRGKLTSITDTGVDIRENFSQLLILEVTGNREFVNLKDDSPPMWNFFQEKGQLTTTEFPFDLDTTAIGLTVVRRDKDTAFEVMEKMLEFVNTDGIVQTYFDHTRPRFDAVVCVNVLGLFYTYDRGYQLTETLQWVREVLYHRAYLDGTRYYETPECFLYFLGRLLKKSGDTELHTDMKGLLKERVQERVGAQGDSLQLAMRILTCLSVGLRNELDLQALLALQYEDGSWVDGGMYKYGSSGVKITNRGLTTALAIKAVEQHAQTVIRPVPALQAPLPESITSRSIRDDTITKHQRKSSWRHSLQRMWYRGSSEASA
uniref:Threonine dehydratase n=2 Tax=Moniliophthora roreri TaxID=221103 RepID=A0A0W0FH08_MONRR